jgi:hypothetical protein
MIVQIFTVAGLLHAPASAPPAVADGIVLAARMPGNSDPNQGNGSPPGYAAGALDADEADPDQAKKPGPKAAGAAPHDAGTAPRAKSPPPPVKQP